MEGGNASFFNYFPFPFFFADTSTNLGPGSGRGKGWGAGLSLLFFFLHPFLPCRHRYCLRLGTKIIMPAGGGEREEKKII